MISPRRVAFLITLLVIHLVAYPFGEAFLFHRHPVIATSRASLTTAAAVTAGLLTTTGVAATAKSSSSSELYLSPPESNDGQENDDDDAYHLLWHPRSWTKFLTTTAALIVTPKLLDAILGTQINALIFSTTITSTTGAAASCHGAASAGTTTTTTSASVSASLLLNHLWHNWALPLLASSCCLLQLVLNALAVGCAGWNKVLGPLRPYFMALLLCTSLSELNKAMTSAVTTSIKPAQQSILLVARTTVALLPEIVHWYNERQEERTHRLLVEQQEQNAPAATTTTTTPTRATTENSHDNDDSQATPLQRQQDDQQRQLKQQLDQIQMDIPSMGCSACVSAVNGALRQIPGVVSAYSRLYGTGGGYAVVIMDPVQTSLASSSSSFLAGGSGSGAPSSSLYESVLTEAVQKAGFDGASVQSVERQL